jgi:hypothetical protein
MNREVIRRAYFRNQRIGRLRNRFRYRDINPTDLFIASYPRSGTTWLRFLLFELLTGEPSGFVSVNKSIPYVGEHQRAPRLLPNGGRVIKTHEVFLRGVGSAIYVVRDPRSVVLSEYLWQLRTGLFEGSFDVFFDGFIAGRANPYGRWDRHVDVWSRSSIQTAGRLLVVRFEDLRGDTHAELKRVLGFLGLNLDRFLIDRAVAHNELAEMRAKEEAAPSWALGARARPEIRFVNSGALADWKDTLRQEQVQTITSEFYESLLAHGYETPSVAPALNGEASVERIGEHVAGGPLHDKPIKVLYIAGWGRSGSTLLDNLLGQVDGFFSTGELRYIWERGILLDWQCGCGRPVKECEVWSIVLAKLHEDGKAPDPRTVVGWQDRVTRIRHTFRLLKLTPETAQDDPIMQSYLNLVKALLSSIVEVTGARVVVDSSKRPSDAAILNLIPGVQLHVIHLVRDPRAVAYSWGKRQPDIDRHGVIGSTSGWVGSNLGADALRRRIPERSMLVRYETFVRDPRSTLEQILELVSEDPKLTPPMRDGAFHVSGTHTVSGNPARFRLGSIEVAPDNQWLDRLGGRRKAAATIIAAPLLRRYGYHMRTSAGS